MLTHLVGADAILVPVMLLGTMSLLRGGRSMFDRLVIAIVLLFTGACLFGLVTSVWPWGFNPVPIAGIALSALVLVAAVTGRRPTVRLNMRATDWIAASGAGLVVLLILEPFVSTNLAGRLRILLPSEDFARHFVLFDTIGLTGGYTFLHQSAAARYMPTGYGLETYPQGAHLVYAMAERFWRSSAAVPNTVTGMSWLLWCHVASMIFFAVATIWAMRRVAGPEVDAARSIAIVGAASAYIFFGDPMVVFLGGFPNELLGLGFAAILIAVAARPLSRLGEQVAVVAALLVAISFTYYMFLPVAGVVAAGYLVGNRKRLLRRKLTTVCGVLLSACALVPVLVNMRANTGSKLLLTGGVAALNTRLLMALLFVVVAGMAIRRSWRSPAWRTVALSIAAAVGLTGAIGGYQYLMRGSTTYYYEKALHLLVVAIIVGFGITARLWPRVTTAGLPLRQRVQRLAPMTALALAAFAMFGAFSGVGTSKGGSWGRALLEHRLGNPNAPARAIRLAQLYPDRGDGMVTVDLSGGAGTNFYSTLYAAVMERNYQASVDWYVFLATWQKHTLADLDNIVAKTSKPVRFILGDPNARFLLVDRRGAERAAGALPVDTGDVRALTNVQAVEYLQHKYPDRVTIVWTQQP